MNISLHNEFNKFLPEAFRHSIFEAMSIAEKNNYKIFLIGGIVRDFILENQIKDIDIAVEDDAICFGQLLKSNINCKILNTQENLRTIKIEFSNGVVIDFASTREEKYTASGVLPVAYNFGCELCKDVLRRDFSINTLAVQLFGEDKFKLVDYCNGYSDIQNKKIRVLHSRSFIDDPSRIIRALKFKERFDFEFEEDTDAYMQKYLDNVNEQMPLERIKGELKQYFEINKKGLYQKLLDTKAYRLISDNPILNFDETKIDELYSYNLFNREESWFIYISLLILNSKYSLKRLNMNSLEKKIIREVQELLNKEKHQITDKIDIYKMFKDLDDLSISVYYVLTEKDYVKKFLSALKEIKVLITGKDLIDLGFIPSPYFNKLFEAVLKEKLEGRLLSKEEEIEFVKKFI